MRTPKRFEVGVDATGLDLIGASSSAERRVRIEEEVEGDALIGASSSTGGTGDVEEEQQEEERKRAAREEEEENKEEKKKLTDL